MNAWGELRNLHKGEIGVVIGNGTGLNNVPLDFLYQYPTFGTNRIYEFNGFSPDYYVCVNPKIITQSQHEIKAVETLKFISNNAIYKGDAIRLNTSTTGHTLPAFSTEPYIWIPEGFTVTYVCLQLAFFMGFKTILLVGVDHKYKHNGKPNQLLVSNGNDPNHFSKDYFPKGYEWNAPDLEKCEQYYALAEQVYRNAGREIINLSDPTELDIFEKGNINKWL